MKRLNFLPEATQLVSVETGFDTGPQLQSPQFYFIFFIILELVRALLNKSTGIKNIVERLDYTHID